MNLQKLMKTAALYARVRRKRKTGASLGKMRRILALSRRTRAV